MEEVCQSCGLPDELCLCEAEEETDETTLSVVTETRGHGNDATIIKDITEDDAEAIADAFGFEDVSELSDLSSCLKSRFSCGGSSDSGELLLQGNHSGDILDVFSESDRVVVSGN